MTLGFHSPMPPARTGVAGYSAALVRALRQYARELDVALNPAQPSECNVYHAGNNQLHREIYHRATTHPGLTVLHDAVLHHFFLGWGDPRAYVDEFIHNYGEWHRGEAERLWRRRARSAHDPAYFRWAMVRRLAERSLMVAVHNQGAKAIVERHAPGARVEILPHIFEAPAPVEEWERIRLRDRYGMSGAFVVGVMGHLRESKRVIPVLDTAARLRRQGVDLRLVLAGEWASRDLATAAAARIEQPWVLRLPYLSERDFWLWAHALDVCVNLRYPAAGETSGIAIRLMGIGRAVVMSGGEESAGFPAGSCVRIDGGLAEQEMLEASLLWLARNPEAVRGIGAAANAWITGEHSAGHVARRFRDLALAALS